LGQYLFAGLKEVGCDMVFMEARRENTAHEIRRLFRGEWAAPTATCADQRSFDERGRASIETGSDLFRHKNAASPGGRLNVSPADLFRLGASVQQNGADTLFS